MHLPQISLSVQKNLFPAGVFCAPFPQEGCDVPRLGVGQGGHLVVGWILGLWVLHSLWVDCLWVVFRPLEHLKVWDLIHLMESDQSESGGK